eukprot:30941-Pelagococcus_subviridis.AAC.12
MGTSVRENAPESASRVSADSTTFPASRVIPDEISANLRFAASRASFSRSRFSRTSRGDGGAFAAAAASLSFSARSASIAARRAAACCAYVCGVVPYEANVGVEFRGVRWS